MTQRLVDGAPAPADGATIVVGAFDWYEARRRSRHEIGDEAGREAPLLRSHRVRSRLTAS
jgi:thymidine kinase